ncbi:MAG: hypothetical protein KC646_07105 [Candidatus Cloacimonetes bacterium]|nr:hypothetical protein [Candidatus Cloacimonadota bacterium]
MKIHILFEMVDGPWGGGNQFLKALKNYLLDEGVYTGSIEESDIILFNSHHSLDQILELREVHPLKCFIHRLDGPVSLIRNSSPVIDQYIFKTNDIVADGTIFQSNWSFKKSIQLGYEDKTPHATIVNAPNPILFNRINRDQHQLVAKLRIIITSWSNNMRKGFDVYQWMDENLDFSKYEITFYGNSPIEFKNIVSKAPLSSEELSIELKKSDVFVTASKSDTCSNSLIEALHCGNVALVYNDGGHPEILGSTGEKFDSVEEIPKLLELIHDDWHNYAKNFDLPNFDQVGKQYMEFMDLTYKNKRDKSHVAGSKKITWKLLKLRLRANELLATIKNKFKF